MPEGGRDFAEFPFLSISLIPTQVTSLFPASVSLAAPGGFPPLPQCLPMLGFPKKQHRALAISARRNLLNRCSVPPI